MKNNLPKLGMNARLFPNNWRPLVDEITFAKQSNFRSMQFSVRERAIAPEFLGCGLDIVAQALDEAKIDLAIELLIGVDESGHTAAGQTPLSLFESHLPAITELGCKFIHWHLVPVGMGSPDEPDPTAPVKISNLERLLIPQFQEAVELSQKHDFQFGFEHNDPDYLLYARPEQCHMLLQAVPGLKFVWDTNHTRPEELPKFKELFSELSIIHVSDTMLPEVNYHLPLGLGNVDFKELAAILIECEFAGPAIFEIGGLMKSGGYGRDTDQALIDSLSHLQNMFDLVLNKKV